MAIKKTIRWKNPKSYGSGDQEKLPCGNSFPYWLSYVHVFWKEHWTKKWVGIRIQDYYKLAVFLRISQLSESQFPHLWCEDNDTSSNSLTDFSETQMQLKAMKSSRGSVCCGFHSDCWWNPEGNHQEGQSLAQALQTVPGDCGQDNTEMIAKTYMPRELCFNH